MNCEEARPLLEEYADGELDAAASARVGAHVESCGSCAQVCGRLAREREFYLLNAPDFSLSPDFWPGVAARVAEERRGGASRLWRGLRARAHETFGTVGGTISAPRFSPALTAALVLVAVGLTAGVMQLLRPREAVREQTRVEQGAGGGEAAIENRSAANESVAQTHGNGDGKVDEKSADGDAGVGGEKKSDDARRMATAGGARDKTLAATNMEAARRVRARAELSQGAATPDELVREAERKYVAAIALLARDARRRPSRLDPVTAARFERTLAAVDRSIAETRRAARQRPRDPVAAQYMLAAYARKVDVLRELADY